MTSVYENFTNSPTNGSVYVKNSIDIFLDGFNLYFPPVMIITGSICNVLVAMVMRSVFFRSISTSFYMCANAITDTFSLAVLLTVDWLHVNFPWTIYRGENAHYMCKVFNFFGWTTSDIGVVLTAAMTLERSLAIIFPLRASSWCTVKRARHTTIVLVFIVCVKNVNFLFTSDTYTSHDADRLCYVYMDTEGMQHFWKYIWPWIHNLFLIISFVIIMVSNAIIIRHIKLSDKMRKLQEMKSERQRTFNGTVLHNTESSKARKQSRKNQSRRRQLALMLLIDSFTVVICILPYSIYTTLVSNIDFLSSSDYELSIKELISSVSFNLLYVNRCANFYLYCMSGSRFREALRKVCICRIKKSEKSKHQQMFSSRYYDSSDIYMETSNVRTISMIVDQDKRI